MKRTLVFIMLVILAGCYAPAKFTIPDAPKFKQLNVYQLEDGICMEGKDIAILQENIGALKSYSEELRRILVDLQKERGR